MTIYRGPGGGGNADSDSEINALTSLTNQALAYSEAAALEADAAAVAAAAASTSAASAATSASGAATSASSTSTSAANAASSASAASTSATNAATSATAAAASAASIDPASLVKVTGDQTIGGIKTFSSTIVGSVNGNAATATNVAYSGLTGTVPTWNQNTTGSATTVTTTIASGAVATTQAAGDNSTKVATTAYVNQVTGTNGITGFKNRIINGAMVIDQRNAGASVAISQATGTYTLDRYRVYEETAGSISVQQVSTAPAGFINSLKVTVTSASGALSATQQTVIQQPIEGLNVTDFGWGTASAATVMLSFWVRASVTGTYGGSFSNEGVTRSYPFSYVISAADTWEQKSITIAGDTTGTWLTTNGTGIRLYMSLGAGTTYSGTAGAWAASQLVSTTGAINLVATNGATFYITGVQLEKGSTATSFDYRPYGTELALCQRYYEQYAMYLGITAFPAYYKVTKRTAPTITSSDTNFTLAGVTPDVNTYWSRDTASGGTFSVYITAEL